MELNVKNVFHRQLVPYEDTGTFLGDDLSFFTGGTLSFFKEITFTIRNCHGRAAPFSRRIRFRMKMDVPYLGW